MKTERAELVTLSTSTKAVLSAAGVTFIRGQHAWALSSRELAKLVEAVKGER